MSEDLTQKFNGSQDDKLNQLITLVQGLTSDLLDMKSDLQDVKSRLLVLEQKVDERLYDTRPLWEGVQAQIAEFKAEVQAQIAEFKADVQAQITEFKAEVQKQISDLKAEVDQGFRKIGRRLDVISIELNQLRADLHDHENRIEALEGTR
ncbi:MAG TPA: hypothetical protein VJH03_18780 [Blastocatellia bacterium]|nr:hypothetical protein [Blastocatellia bacterium]